jgi:predicted Zn-dependent protease
MWHMIQDYPNTRPTPEERIAEARRVFQARYGREPARVLVNPAQATAGAEAEGRVGLGVVWCQIGEASE